MRTSTSKSLALSSFDRRRQVIADTLERTDALIASTPGVSEESAFYRMTDDNCLPLGACPNFPPTAVRVLNEDAFRVARDILKDPDAAGKTAVLNLASDREPGGGWVYTVSITQEEALCYSSTLYKTLKPEYYPWPNKGPQSIAGIYSPAVLIFKDDLAHNCVDLPVGDRKIVSVLTIAAPCGPTLTDDLESFKFAVDLENLRDKIRLVYRMAASKGNDRIVLGAMGCGAYYCPPRLVATEMRDILVNEFKGWWKEVVFAVVQSSFDRRSKGNFDIFHEVFAGVKV